LTAQTPQPKVRIGVTDWNIELPATVGAIDYAADLGFDGVEVSLGRESVGGKLVLDNPALVKEYRQRAAARRLSIAGTCLDILNRECLKNNDRAVEWVRDGIRITRLLGTGVMLVPFFGKDCSAETSAEIQAVAGFMKDLAPLAAKAGVVLGLENWLSAEDNARLLDQIGSPAVRVYYDVGNSTRRGRDVVKEIRWLGNDRICQVHIKENPITLHLGEGQMDFAAIVQVLVEIGYNGWANLEMSFPPAARREALRRNQAYVRDLFGSAKRTGA
jgi:sugar phosphate isomerase/epimerase